MSDPKYQILLITNSAELVKTLSIKVAKVEVILVD